MTRKNIIFDDNNVIKPLCIKLSQMIGYVKHFDNNKTMLFKVNDDKMLKKYTKLWEKVSILMNIEFDSETVYGNNDKYIKAKIKSNGNNVNTHFKAKNTKRKSII